jgi:1-phosphatidylinositol-4-phosphate 5-kinase
MEGGDNPMHDDTDPEGGATASPHQTGAARCPYTVSGVHEPNLILKDNDIKYKIRLSLDHTVNLLRQIRLDAEFLYSCGIMDYSLLVGVHNTEYEVKDGAGGDTLTPRLTRLPSQKNLTLVDPNRRRESAAQLLQLQQQQQNQEKQQQQLGGKPSVVSFANSNGSNQPESVEMNHLSSSSSSPKAATEIASNNNTTARESTETVDVSLDNTNAELMNTTLDSTAGLAQRLEVYKVVGPDAYFIGIIDFQQKWNFGKKVTRKKGICVPRSYCFSVSFQMERFFKVNFRGADPQGLSAIEPETYKERYSALLVLFFFIPFSDCLFFLFFPSDSCGRSKILSISRVSGESPV